MVLQFVKMFFVTFSRSSQDDICHFRDGWTCIKSNTVIRSCFRVQLYPVRCLTVCGCGTISAKITGLSPRIVARTKRVHDCSSIDIFYLNATARRFSTLYNKFNFLVFFFCALFR